MLALLLYRKAILVGREMGRNACGQIEHAGRCCERGAPSAAGLAWGRSEVAVVPSARRGAVSQSLRLWCEPSDAPTELNLALQVPR